MNVNGREQNALAHSLSLSLSLPILPLLHLTHKEHLLMIKNKIKQSCNGITQNCFGELVTFLYYFIVQPQQKEALQTGEIHLNWREKRH